MIHAARPPLRRWIGRAGLGALSALLSTSVLVPQSAAQESLTVLRGGHYFDSELRAMVPIEAIVIRGGKILEVNPEASRFDLSEAREIEIGTDEYVLPGIFDLHAHYNVTLMGRPRNDELVAMPAIFLANGVTSTFPAGEYDPEGMRDLRIRIDRGEVPGPRLFNAGPYYGSTRAGWDREMTREELYADVDYWVEQGAKGFKAKGIGPDHLRWLIERAHFHGLTVTGHLGSGFRDTVNPKDAILMGIDRVEHFMGGDAFLDIRSAYASFADVEPGTPEFDDIIDLFLSYDVTYDATITAYGYYSDRSDGLFEYWTDETRFYTPEVRAYYRENDPRPFSQNFNDIYHSKCPRVKAFHDAGIRITLGTDHPSAGEFISGFSAHRELAAFVKCGISEADALLIATRNGAQALNVAERFGSIEAGKIADLFVVSGDPLADITNTRNVRTVMKSGYLFDPDALLDSVEGRLGPRPATNEGGL